MSKTKRLSVVLFLICILIVSAVITIAIPKSINANELKTGWTLAEAFGAGGIDSAGAFKAVSGDSGKKLEMKPMTWSTDQYTGNGNFISHGAHCSHGEHSYPDNAGIHIMPGENKIIGAMWEAPYSGNFKFDFKAGWAFYTMAPDYGGAVENGTPKPEFGGATFSIDVVKDGALVELISNEYSFSDLSGEGNEWKTMTGSYQLEKGDKAYFNVNAKNLSDENDRNWWDNYFVEAAVNKIAVSSKIDFPSNGQGQNNLFAMWAGENKFDELSVSNVTYREADGDYKGALDYAFVQRNNLMTDRGVSALMYVAQAKAAYSVSFKYKWASNRESGGGNGAKFGIGTLVEQTLTKVGTEQVKGAADLVDSETGEAVEFTITEQVSLNYGDGVFVYIDSNGDGGWDNYLYEADFSVVGESEIAVIAVNYPSGSTGLMNVTDTMQLTAVVGGASTSLVEWSTENASVATVSASGKVTAISSGTTNIVAKIGTSEVKKSIQVASSDLSVVVSGEGNQNTLQERKTLQLSKELTFREQDVTADGEYTWSSSDTGIVTVDDNGLLTGVSGGTATITLVAEYDGQTAMATFDVTVTEGVEVTISGSTLAMVGGNTITLTASAENTAETAVTWASETPDILSVTSGGVVTGIKYGYGVVSAEIDGTKAFHAVSVKKEYSSAGTLWDFYSDFPMEQGENGFTIVYGPSGDIAEDTSYLTLLSGLECSRSTDVPSGSPQQWKGGSTYATLSQAFIMPGDGAMGFKFLAPANGTYRVNLSFEWTMAARSQLPTPESANSNNFDGVTIGIAKISADGNTATVVYSKLADYTYLTAVGTEKTLEEINIQLSKDEQILFFVDNNGNGGYDQYDYTASIANTEYEGEKVDDLTPSVEVRNYVFDMSDVKDVVVDVDLKGKDITSLKLNGAAINSGNYAYANGKLTIKKEYLKGLGAGLKTVTITTDGGSCDIKINIKAAETDDKDESKIGLIIGLSVGGGVLVLGGAFAVWWFLIRKKNIVK